MTPVRVLTVTVRGLFTFLSTLGWALDQAIAARDPRHRTN